MIRDILTNTGVPFRRGRFLRAPAETYAVYFDDRRVEGADRLPSHPAGGTPRIYHHDVWVELYEPAPDDNIESALEAELDARGILWTKEDRQWLDTEQLYYVLYEFEYTSKT